MIFLLQLHQLFNGHTLACVSAATGANIVNNTIIAAHGVTVYRVVYRAIADACFFHAANNTLKRIDVLANIAVKLYIADVACVCQRMEGCFFLDFLKCADGVINGNMERVCVVVTVGNAGDIAKLFLVYADKRARKTPAGVASRVKLSPVFSDSSSILFLI